MPRLDPPTIALDNFDSMDRSYTLIAEGPIDEADLEAGTVDIKRISKKNGAYKYDRLKGHPQHFPLDCHLFPFIQSYVPVDMEVNDPLLPAEQCNLEKAILWGWDSML